MRYLCFFILFISFQPFSQTLDDKLNYVKSLIEKGENNLAVVESKKVIFALSEKDVSWKPEFLRICGNAFANNSDSAIVYYNSSYNELLKQNRKYSIESLKALNNISNTLRSKNPERALKTLKDAFEISDSIGCNEYFFCLIYF